MNAFVLVGEAIVDFVATPERLLPRALSVADAAEGRHARNREG
jgi:hypothetical protein